MRLLLSLFGHTLDVSLDRDSCDHDEPADDAPTVTTGNIVGFVRDEPEQWEIPGVDR